MATSLVVFIYSMSEVLPAHIFLKLFMRDKLTTILFFPLKIEFNVINLRLMSSTENWTKWLLVKPRIFKFILNTARFQLILKSTNFY